MESGLMTGEQTADLSSKQIEPMSTEQPTSYGSSVTYKALPVSQNPIEDLKKVNSVYIGFYDPCCACPQCGCEDCCKCQCQCCNCCSDIEFEFLVHADVEENGSTQQKLLFTLLQRSPCCQTSCLHPKFREMELSLGKVVSTSKAEVVQSYHQKKSSPGCCGSYCFEPKIYMNVPQTSPNPVLRGQSQCDSCCELVVNAYDDQGQSLKYILNGSVCQCARLCPCCDFIFNILSGDSKAQIGTTHVLANCNRRKGCCANHTNFMKINFPEGISPEEKMKIIYASYYTLIAY